MINFPTNCGAKSTLLILSLALTIAAAPPCYARATRSAIPAAPAFDAATDETALINELTSELILTNHLLDRCDADRDDKTFDYFEFLIGTAAGVVVVLLAGAALRLVD